MEANTRVAFCMLHHIIRALKNGKQPAICCEYSVKIGAYCAWKYVSFYYYLDNYLSVL